MVIYNLSTIEPGPELSYIWDHTLTGVITEWVNNDSHVNKKNW